MKMDDVRWIFVVVCLQDIVGADAMEGYADQLLLMNEVSPNGLLAKGLYLFKTENFVAARDFLNKGTYPVFVGIKTDDKIF